jgi:ATP-binding cassette subfamily F protein 3
MEAIDGFNAEIRAATILSGLGFLNGDLQRPLSDFSCDWQIHAALAATLFAPSNIFLLDEPSNHLDFEISLWLKNYPQKIHGQKTILMISHERDFLNTLCDKILHLPSGNLYSGNYDTFIETRANQQQALARRIEKQEVTRKHLQSFVDRFRSKASKAKQAQSRTKMLEKKWRNCRNRTAITRLVFPFLIRSRSIPY